MRKTTFTEAFSLADDVLYQGVKGVTDLMVRPGLINLDFADVRAVMDEMGKAMMGTGEADGEDRAIQAAEKGHCQPAAGRNFSLRGAKGVLINITGSTRSDTCSNWTKPQTASAKKWIRTPTSSLVPRLDRRIEGGMRVSLLPLASTHRKSGRHHRCRRRSRMRPLKPAAPERG